VRFFYLSLPRGKTLILSPEEALPWLIEACADRAN
jgi:hypothetical protein